MSAEFQLSGFNVLKCCRHRNTIYLHKEYNEFITLRNTTKEVKLEAIIEESKLTALVL